MSRDAHSQIVAGRVGRAHGLDGSFYVTEPSARLLEKGMALRIAGRELKITRCAGTEQRPIVRLEGIESREQAQALRGEALEAPLEHAPKLGPDEYWSHELEGCEVLDGERTVGVVTRLLQLPSCEALEVRAADGGELLIPMVRAAIRAVEVPARRIQIDTHFLGE